MELFDKVSETIMTKGQQAVDKAKELATIASLKSQIASCEEVIQKNYAEIGRLYYKENGSAEENPYAKQCKAIENAKKGIEDLERKIRETKGI